jgi:hypothetical protein
VYVSPEHRRKGLFSLLYNHVRNAACAAKACGLRLYADDQNSNAHATYERLGMKSHYKVIISINHLFKEHDPTIPAMQALKGSSPLGKSLKVEMLCIFVAFRTLGMLF